MCDVTIVGGGVIGLATARELAIAGATVRVLERGAFGREASWAGAGMLPPGNLELANSPEARLRGLSAQLWPRWAEELAAETGVDFGYQKSSAIRLFEDEGVRDDELSHWWAEGVPAEPIDAGQVAELEPHITARGGCGIHLPTQAQIRNPRYVKALAASCAGQGVELVDHVGRVDWVDASDIRRGLRAGSGTYQSDRYCIAAGAWSRDLLDPLGCCLPIKPVRGQIALLNDSRRLLSRIVEQGLQYVVPRGDGRILVGSTMEKVGFDKRVTAAGLGELFQFVQRICPQLSQAAIERTWAGLRPGSPDGLPFLGAVPGHDNVFVAAGHFRSGLQMSPGTARLMAAAIRAQSTVIDLNEYSLTRIESGACAR